MDSPRTVNDGQTSEGENQAPAGPDWLQLASEAYDGSTSYLDTNYRAQWERNIRQFRSQHPLGSRYLSDTWKHKSRFFRPKTRTAVRKAEAAAAAALFSTADVVDIEAVDDNDERQQASAAFWKEAMNHRLTKSVPWFVTVMGAYQESQVMGAIVSHQDWDFDNDRPSPELRPLENIRIDPGANWSDPINTSPYLIDMLPMYAFEVKERGARTDNLKWEPVSDGDLAKAKQGVFDSTRLAREGAGRTDPKESQHTSIQDFDIVWVMRVFMRRDGRDVVYYTLGRDKLLSDPIDAAVAYPWLPKRKRPYVMGICVVEAHRSMPAGPVELAAPVQSEVNTLVNQRRDNVDLVLNMRYFVKRHKQVDIRSLTRNIPGAVTMMEDPEKDVREIQWKDVTSSAYQEEDRLNLDHDDLTGTFSGASVVSNRKLNETVGGMNHLSTELNEVGDYTLMTFRETWLEPVLSQILLLEQYYESDETIVALAGNKAKLVQKFGISVVDDAFLKQQLTLTVNIGMGATNPINAMERFMAGVERLSKVFGPELVAQRLDFNEVVSELFGKLGYKDGTRFMLDMDDPRVASLMQTINELQTKLAQKRSPEVDAADAMQKRAAATKTMVEAIFGSTQAAEIIAAIPETAPVADSVLEAAGYQRPNPPGVDPNLQAPVRPALAAAPAVPPNTSPQQPAVPASATAGATAGIEGGA